MSSHHAEGSDAVVGLMRGFADVGFETLDNIHVASRGDRLVLLRRISRTATGFELRMLLVVETDAAGLIASLVLLDVDAIVAALDELEIRFARSGALALPERQVLLGFAGLNHRAWAELDAVLAPDLAVADHRLLGFPAADGKEHLVGALRALVAQVPDVVAIVQDLEVSGPAVLALTQQVGTSTDGAAADWTCHFVVAIGGDSLIARMEYFDADDAPRARARFDELAHADVIERLVRTFTRVYNTRDWDGLRAAYPDVVMVDHRPASFGEMVGAEALIEHLGGLLELVPDLRVEVPEIAAVGEHGVVFRMVGSGHSTDGGEVEIDIVLCSTLSGDLVRAETFQSDAMDAAVECWRTACA